jgi:hypothetical protein
VNAAASVLGSVSAISLAIHVGLAQTVLLGGLFYLGALAAVLVSVPSPRREAKTVPSLASVGLSK